LRITQKPTLSAHDKTVRSLSLRVSYLLRPTISVAPLSTKRAAPISLFLLGKHQSNSHQLFVLNYRFKSLPLISASALYQLPFSLLFPSQLTKRLPKFHCCHMSRSECCCCCCALSFSTFGLRFAHNNTAVRPTDQTNATYVNGERSGRLPVTADAGTLLQ
jgi:hypothetical protein